MRMDHAYRHTKVIFTVGPASDSEERLEALLKLGADICRLNMAHATHAWTSETILRIREVSRRIDRDIAILMDVKGPEIRTGAIDAPLQLERDQLLDLYTDPDAVTEADRGSVAGVSVNYPGLGQDLKPGDTVLVDSGLIRLRVEAIHEHFIRTNVRIGGAMGSRRHINLPGIEVDLPALTEKDHADIQTGVECGVDFFALSFVRKAADLDTLRDHLSKLRYEAPIIAKIEDQSAITHLDDIIKASDGLMVARGDLGIEIPFENLPVVQRRAVNTCLTLGKPVIVATHMLESMIQQPVPTRAEITDVANAVGEQTDCVMLSGETAVGSYPTECLEALNKIIAATEKTGGPAYNDRIQLQTPKALMLRSAVTLCDAIDDCSILVFTRTGYLARMLSALRPRRSPIFAFTDNDRIFRQLLLYWGVEPFLMDFAGNSRATIGQAKQRLRSSGWCRPGDRLVVVTNLLEDERVIDAIQLRTVD